jgi:hypothetical protein
MMDNWPSIMEYAAVTGNSVSTIRRHLKRGLLKFKLVQGKYFIQVPIQDVASEPCHEAQIMALKLEIERLGIALRRLHNENSELKTLVLLYEKGQLEELPELPSLER